MLRRRFAFFAASAIQTARPARAQSWIEYRPAGAGYRIEFPGSPEVSSDSSAGTRYGTSATATAKLEISNGIAFFATHTTYPSGTASGEPQKVLDTLSFGRTAIGSVRSARRFVFEGHPCQRQIVDWHGPRPVVIVALDVIRADQLYSMFCFAPPGLEDSPAIARFLNSFALLPQ